MPYSVLYNKKTNCINVEVVGMLDLPLLKLLAGDVAKISKEQNCEKVLNDLRKAKASPNMTEIFYMPQTAQSSGITRVCKRALVVKNISHEFDFMETVFKNQGHIVKLFTDIKQAEVWLGE